MHPDDVQIARVWTREVGSQCADETFPNNANFEIVVDVEAGSTVANTDQPAFVVELTVKDLTHWSTCPAVPVLGPNQPGFSGNVCNSPAWPGGANPHQFVFTVNAADLTPPGMDRTNHVFSAHAVLIVGAANPNTSFAESKPFVVHAP